MRKALLFLFIIMTIAIFILQFGSMIQTNFSNLKAIRGTLGASMVWRSGTYFIGGGYGDYF